MERMDVDTNDNGDCIDDYSHETYGFERYRFFQDANWNVVGIWAEHGNQIVERYEYDAYGASRVFKGWDADAACESLNVIGDSLIPGGNPIRYAGYYYDDETGLYHVRHRMYSPSLAIWAQRDPAEYEDSLNLYQYLQSDPVGDTDPSGLGLACWWNCYKCGSGAAKVKQCSDTGNQLYNICLSVVDPDPRQGLGPCHKKYPPPTMEDCLRLRCWYVQTCLAKLAQASPACAKCVKCMVTTLCKVSIGK
jgi:RHS repeat-associated protein